MRRRRRLSRARLIVCVLLLCLACVDARSSAGRLGASSGRSSAARRFGGVSTRGAAATRARGAPSARQAGTRSSVNAAARAAARGVGAGVSFDRRARPALASSRPAGTRGGLGAGARAAEGPARPAERSAPQFGAGTRYEARRPKTAAAGAGGAETAALAAAARARARPGLASNAGEAGNDLSRASSPAVRETARPEKSVSAEAFFTASSADAADVSSPAYARESPRVDVRRRDGHAEQSRENVAVADADAERLSAGRVGKVASATEPAIRVAPRERKEGETESANDVAEDALVSFRERDLSLNPEPGPFGTGGTTIPETDGLAADLGVATSGASSDADVPGDLPGDVEEPFAVVPDATDPAVIPAPRPLGDTAGGADTQVPAAAQAAVTSGAREQTAGIDLGTGTGPETERGRERGPRRRRRPRRLFCLRRRRTTTSPISHRKMVRTSRRFPRLPTGHRSRTKTKTRIKVRDRARPAPRTRTRTPLPPEPNVLFLGTPSETRVVLLRISGAGATSAGRTRRAVSSGEASSASPSAARRRSGRRKTQKTFSTGGTSSASAKTSPTRVSSS
jgi:hypothetical protein